MFNLLGKKMRLVSLIWRQGMFRAIVESAIWEMRLDVQAVLMLGFQRLRPETE